MMRKRNSRKLVIGVTFLSIFFLGLFWQMDFSYAQGDEKSHKIPLSFELEEFFEVNDREENTTSIDIDIGSDTYNITGIEINFTNIKMERQIKVIEDEDLGFDAIYSRLSGITHKYAYGLGVQMDLENDTTLYGVYIYGFKEPTTTVNISIQIRGYNIGTNGPSNEIHLNQTLNMSTPRAWYYQKFTTPKFLTKGDYYLVFNGSNLPIDESNIYYWGLNDIFPDNPLLYSGIFDWKYDPNWKVDTDSPFLYKLDQKINKTFYPKEIEMEAYINGEWHDVKDGSMSGTGNLTLPNINFSPGVDTLDIPIRNNDSINLNYTIDYHINLKGMLTSGGTVLVRESYNNTWTVNPTFSRTSNNYSLKFSYAQSWFNLSVFHNGGPLSNGTHYLDDSESIYIFNDTITDNLDWEITANSEKIPIDTGINLLGPFSPGDDLVITLNKPLLEESNFTLILYALDSHYENITQEYPFVDFEFTLPSVNGNWTVFVIWNNLTDVGIDSYNFMVSGTTPTTPGGGGDGGGGGSTTVTGLDPSLVLTISLIIIFAIAGSLTSYQMIKRLKRKRDLQMQKLRNKVIDSLNLNYIMISENASGLNVFEQYFGGKEIDPTLISGFLAAIRSFGIELTGTFQQSQTIKLDFQNSKILMNEFRHFRLILLMGENPSEDFIESLDTLAQDVEKSYGELIRDFDGKLDKFTGIGKLIEHHLNVSFLFPLKVTSTEGSKLTPTERSVYNKAKEIMKQNSLDYIFTSFLMDDQTYEPKRIKAIFGLLDKEIFQPIRLEDRNFKN